MINWQNYQEMQKELKNRTSILSADIIEYWLSSQLGLASNKKKNPVKSLATAYANIYRKEYKIRDFRSIDCLAENNQEFLIVGKI